MSLLLVGQDGTPYQRIKIPPGAGEGQRTATAMIDGRPMTSPELQAMLDSGEVYYGILPDAAYLPLYRGQPGFSYAIQAWVEQGIPRFYQGGPLQPPNDQGYPIGYQGPRGIVAVGENTNTYTPTALQTQGAPGRGGSMSPRYSNKLLLELLSDQPVITDFIAAITTLAAAEAVGGSVAATNKALQNVCMAAQKFAAVQAYVGNANLYELLLTPGQAMDPFTEINVLTLGPAGSALLLAIAASFDLLTVPATTVTQGPALVPLVAGFRVFATQMAGMFGSLLTAGSNTALLLVFSQGGGNSIIPRSALIDAMLLGPASATFEAACVTAEAALAADVLYTDVQPDIAPFFAALLAYLSALANSKLFGAIGF